MKKTVVPSQADITSEQMILSPESDGVIGIPTRYPKKGATVLVRCSDEKPTPRSDLSHSSTSSTISPGGSGSPGRDALVASAPGESWEGRACRVRVTTVATSATLP